jgi:glycosyltransferase involved in cell wall biosynthesis
MKVLMINVVCGIRSTGRICTDLATALEAKGHEVKIAYGRENVPEQFQKYAVRIGTDFDVKLHGVRARLIDGAGFGSKQATVKFIQWIKEYDPDVIHLHNIHGYYVNVEVLFDYLRSCGKKIIWTLHDCWAFTGHSAYCDAIQCEKWKSVCSKCPMIQEYPKSFLDRSERNWLKKKSVFTGIPNMTIVTPSQWLAGLVRESFLKEYLVEVIHNGIDTTQFKPLENDFRVVYNLKDKFILLGVSTVWNDLKGYSDFIKLSEMLDSHYQIVLVGVTDEQIEELPNNILGIKRTSSVKELSYLYSSADVFLNLTYCDSFGQVNVEAALCGTPVIAYDTGGCRESVSTNGYVVKQGSLEDIIDKIHLIEQQGFEVSIGSGEYSIEKFVENYDAITINGGTGQ